MRIAKRVSVVLIGMFMAISSANIVISQEMVTDGLVGFWTFDKSDVVGGTVKEVRIYNRALTEDEVIQNFNIKSNLLAVEPTSKLATLWGRLKIQ